VLEVIAVPFDFLALSPFEVVEWICLVSAVCGSVFVVFCLLTMVWIRVRRPPLKVRFADLPPVTVLKPIHGLEKNLRENLRSTCIQDYPQFQVVFSVQELDDPAIPLLREMEQEFGPERVTVAVENYQLGTNGKINNLAGGLTKAKHDILVISDSDIRLKSDYLKTIVPPLADPDVGCVCTLYKAVCAERWFERIEMLTLSADLIPSAVFAHITGASEVCFGATTALRRQTLDQIGGLQALADYLVEDFEMGQRIAGLGKKVLLIPYVVETIVDLKDASQWWNHQVYWDQNNRAARPIAFLMTYLIRSVPFALLYAILRMGEPLGLKLLAAAIAIRLLTAAIVVGWGLRDYEGFKNLALLPLRDLMALVSFILAYTKRTTIWRGKEFVLTRDGRIVARRS
jgi:ceramide glucosyltransferase